MLAGERVFEVRARSPRGTADPTPARKALADRVRGARARPRPARRAAPETKADAPQAGEMTLLADSTKFLYTGADPIQKGVADGAIEPLRAAVLRGRVTRRNGSPVEGVEVSVLDRPELGHTATRTDGGFDLAVNGGGFVTVAFKRAGYIPSQRQLEVPTQDFETVEDVVLVPYDDRVTGVDLDDGELQVAQGAPITDGDGTRRATLLFEPGTEATATLPDGSTKELGDRLNIRATEFTIGEVRPGRDARRAAADLGLHLRGRVLRRRGQPRTRPSTCASTSPSSPTSTTCSASPPARPCRWATTTASRAAGSPPTTAS